MANTMEVGKVLPRDALAKEIANLWDKYNEGRKDWLLQNQELRNYLFSTSTKTTTNAKLPWKNSTVTPKLTQIRDNLHANYMAALFPNDNWLVWEGDDQDSVSREKRALIESYMRNKLKASGFYKTVSQLIYDYIDSGNVIAGHEHIHKVTKDEAGALVTVYKGPRAFRVNPIDIVFDPTATSFDDSPIIHRVLKTMGDLKKDLKNKPNLQYSKDAIAKLEKFRKEYIDYTDEIKKENLRVDGFSSWDNYVSSGHVELLHFWGDLYDVSTGTLYENQIITVADRMFVLRRLDNPSWLGEKPYKHCGWRLRPDNLWAQGPLDQLVGMQYRIDHLENLKADVFDLIAHPVTKVKGSTVEEFEFGPGVTIFLGDEGDVQFDRPDANALSADMQIQNLMQKMEELAGAPRDAMGIRTPGEKTKYEVQVLENGAGRIFQSKVNWIETNVIEPLINSMLEDARRNLTEKDSLRLENSLTGAAEFRSITKEDITATGRLYPMGSRHFAEQAKFTQELTTTMQLIEQLPTVKPHVSGKAVAKALEHVLGWQRYGMVSPNVAISEQMETAKLMQSAEESIMRDGMTPSEPQPEDFEEAPE